MKISASVILTRIMSTLIERIEMAIGIFYTNFYCGKMDHMPRVFQLRKLAEILAEIHKISYNLESNLKIRSQDYMLDIMWNYSALALGEEIPNELRCAVIHPPLRVLRFIRYGYCRYSDKLDIKNINRRWCGMSFESWSDTLHVCPDHRQILAESSTCVERRLPRPIAEICLDYMINGYGEEMRMLASRDQMSIEPPTSN